MSNLKRRLLGMGLPFLFAFLLDFGLTLHGQPAAYWAGNYACSTEQAPFFRRLYVIHPLAAVAGASTWAGLTIGLLVLLPEVLAMILFIFVVDAHIHGAYSWIIPTIVDKVGQDRFFKVEWYQFGMGTNLAAAIIIGVALHWSHVAREKNVETSAGRLPTWLRWGLIILFSGTALVMIFAPW